MKNKKEHKPASLSPKLPKLSNPKIKTTNTAKSKTPKSSTKTNVETLTLPVLKAAQKETKRKVKSVIKEKQKREAWIAKRQLKYPNKSKKELLASYKKHKAVLTSPEHKAKIAARRQAKAKAQQHEQDKKENLLKQYKKVTDKYNLPTEREIAFDNFLQSIDELPSDLRFKYLQVLDYIRAQYPDDVIAYYMDMNDYDLLKDVQSYSKISYKVAVIESYLKDLVNFLEDFTAGSLSDEIDLSSEEPWSVYEDRRYNRDIYGMDEIKFSDLRKATEEYFDSLWED